VVPYFAHSYVSSIKLPLIPMVISLRVVLKACLTSQTALVRLGQLIVANRLDKVEDYVGVGLQAEEPNGKQQGHSRKHSGEAER
jgi:hypothetical protein